MNAGIVKELRSNATLKIVPRRGGLFISSRAGTLLVTQEHDPKDHVLEAGDGIRMAGRGVVVVWALSDGAVVVESASRTWRDRGAAGIPAPHSDPPARAA
jgi:hypothetical protein